MLRILNKNNTEVTLIVHDIDKENDIEFETDNECIFLTVLQTKQLIEFLTEQIKDK